MCSDLLLLNRYGGEEFAIILGGTKKEYAKHVAEETLKNTRALKLEHEFSLVKNRKIITLSGGVATLLAEKDGDAEKLIVLADKALYRAKEAGRNRIEA